jgi:hypothetical protein
MRRAWMSKASWDAVPRAAIPLPGSTTRRTPGIANRPLIAGGREYAAVEATAGCGIAYPRSAQSSASCPGSASTPERVSASSLAGSTGAASIGSGSATATAGAGAAHAAATGADAGVGAVAIPETCSTCSRRFHQTYAAVATSAVAVTAATVTAVRPRLPRGAASTASAAASTASRAASRPRSRSS